MGEASGLRDELLRLSPGLLAQALSYQLDLQESVTAQEGQCVHVPCTFSYPWLTFTTPYMSWFQKGADVNRDPPVATNKPNQKLHERTRGRFFLRGDLQTKNCSLDITGVHMGDSGTYFFQIGSYSYLESMLSLSVTGMVRAQGKAPEIDKRMFCSSRGCEGWRQPRPGTGQDDKMTRVPDILSVLTALTHTPAILAPRTLEAGRPGNLTCSVPWVCDQGTPPVFSWASAALSSLGPRTNISSVLTLTPRSQDHGTNLTCQVYLPAAGVMVERTVQLKVACECGARMHTSLRV